MAELTSMDPVVALCKRRGFVFPASEIYGGIANTYDYGHYGVLLKRNVIDAWWRAMLEERDDCRGARLGHHPAPPHLGGERPPRGLHGSADRLPQVQAALPRRPPRGGPGQTAEHEGVRCGVASSKLPGEHTECDLTEAREFNLMFETSIGPVKDAGSTVFLRPETAQGIFLNFKNVLQFSRRAAVRHRAGRQVVPQRDHPGQLHLPHARVRADGDGVLRPARRGRAWYEHWKQARFGSVHALRDPGDKLRLRAHDPDELSHYSSATSDVEYEFPIGWSELEGIANRGDFDLTQHAQHSGEKLEYYDQQTKERYVPHVIEPAAGVGRSVLAFLCDAYEEEDLGSDTRTVLRLHPALAPIKVAVLPLVRKDGQPELAREIHDALRERRVVAEYDEGGSIGKRYRRQDEIGTPYGVTVDHQTLEDRTVTLRDRDTLAQERVPIDGLREVLEARLRR
jgi:glycyl-tRNA synthetase